MSGVGQPRGQASLLDQCGGVDQRPPSQVGVPALQARRGQQLVEEPPELLALPVGDAQQLLLLARAGGDLHLHRAPEYPAARHSWPAAHLHIASRRGAPRFRRNLKRIDPRGAPGSPPGCRAGRICTVWLACPTAPRRLGAPQRLSMPLGSSDLSLSSGPSQGQSGPAAYWNCGRSPAWPVLVGVPGRGTVLPGAVSG
jgi:hypothetical protein